LAYSNVTIKTNMRVCVCVRARLGNLKEARTHVGDLGTDRKIKY